jgi:IS30 family transposase
VPQPVAKYQRRQIATDLGRSRSTIANQISRARARLSAPRDVDALVECLASGIVTLDEILARRQARRTKDQENITGS